MVYEDLVTDFEDIVDRLFSLYSFPGKRDVLSSIRVNLWFNQPLNGKLESL